MVEFIKCEGCSTPFEPCRNDKRIKFCSKKCREYNWVDSNKKRNSELKRKSRNKKIRSCKLCTKNIPKALNGKNTQFCSDHCKKKSRLSSYKKSSHKAHVKFREHKESCGCQKCGYNKYGGAIDFHHIDPTEKERRISAKMFSSNSSLAKKEIEKCVLVCKNCHYELHQLIRDDIMGYNDVIKKIKENGDV